MLTRTILLFLLLAGTGLAQAQDREAARDKNVLLILVDDLRPAIGAYGDALAVTPHIDRLAEAGVVFHRAYTNVPVCGASRASMFSGLAPTPSRFVSYDSRIDVDVPDSISMPLFFKQRGYSVRGAGKVLDGVDDSVDHWSEAIWNPVDQWQSPVVADSRRNELQKAYLSTEEGELGPAFERLDVADNAYPDGQLTDHAIEQFTRLQRADAPFFFAIGFRKPHLPFNAPEKYWQMFQREMFAMPRTWQVPRSPRQAFHNSPELRAQYLGYPRGSEITTAQAQELMHAYYASVSYIDAQIGRLMNALDRLGLSESTTIVLVGDHGWNLGEHGMWTKHNLFEEAMRVPLIVVDGVHKGDSEVVVDLLDVFPTLAGSEARDLNLDGEPLPMLGGKGKGYSVGRFLDGETVRSARYRYSQWYDSNGDVVAAQLHDLGQDPASEHNIVEELDGVVRELQQVLGKRYEPIPAAVIQGGARLRSF